MKIYYETRPHRVTLNELQLNKTDYQKIVETNSVLQEREKLRANVH